MSKLPIGDYCVTTNYRFTKLPNKQQIVNTINPHSYITSLSDPDFREALLRSDILLPDGVGVVWALRHLYGKRVKKMAGADLHICVLEQLNKLSGSCFYLGASIKTLEEIEKRIHKEYPNIRVASFSPPYKPAFSEKDCLLMQDEVNRCHPDVLFVGMTAPKQEKWIEENRTYLNAKQISGIGAVFGFFAGTTKRPPAWMVSCGIEWLGRLLKEPKRMWRRNFVSTPRFVFHILKLKITT